MRIAVWHNLPSGGGKRALYAHVKGLVECGHTVQSWCPPSADQSYLPLNELIEERVLPLAGDIRAAGKCSRLMKPYKLLKAVDEHCRQCAHEINRSGFDVLLANSCMYFRTASIGRYVNIPKLLYLGEPNRQLYEALPQLPWVALPHHRGRWISIRYLRDYVNDLLTVQALRVQAREELYSARSFDMILVNSYYSRESVLRSYGLDAKVCYLGIDNRKFINYHLPRDNFIVGVGALIPEKNIELVLESISRIPKPRPALVWIGNAVSKPYLNRLKVLAHALDVTLICKVRISDDELVETLNRASLMVYAPRLEPFGLTPLEANACGLPVVAVAEGGIRETIVDGKNGLLVEHDPASIAQAIIRFLTDRKFAAEIGRNAERLVSERWSLAAATERIENRLFEVVRSQIP